MIERELNSEEMKAIYAFIRESKLEPISIDREAKCSMLNYIIDGKKYSLVYDQDCDWFLDIAYVVE